MEDEIADAQPPPAVLRVLNPVLKAAIRSPLGRRLGGFAILTFSGRRSGRRYDVVVTWHELDGRPVVVTPSSWRANFADGGAPVMLLHRGTRLHGTGELVTDAPTVADAVARLQDAGEPLRAFGLAGPADQLVTAADVSRTGRALVTIRTG